MLHSLMLALLAMMLPTAPSAAVCTAESALRARHEISQRCVTDFGTQAREARQQITRKYGDHASDSTHASRGGAAAAEASSAANAVRLGKQLASEEAAAELLSGGGKVIAGPGTTTPLRAAGRLASEYGGSAADWVKVTSTAERPLQIHAYRNLITGEVVELKSVIP